MDATAIISGLLSGLTSGAVLSAIMASLLRKRTATIEAKIKDQFDQSLTIFRSSRTWNEKSLSDLLGPLYMQFDRSKRAFGRYQGGNLFVEAKVIGEANRTIRDLLLTCPHLIPPELLLDAARLIEHYDRWIEEFESLRLSAKPNLDERFVFVGNKGYPFPRDAEDRFKAAFLTLWKKTYGAA